MHHLFDAMLRDDIFHGTLSLLLSKAIESVNVH